MAFCKGGIQSKSADATDADVGDNVAILSESFCFLCPPTIVDEQVKVKALVGVLI
jgi:hypothetical protein